MNAFIAPEPDFSIHVELEGAVADVAVSGELDLATAPKLARALEDLPLTASDVRLSLAAVWFADASAISRLARSHHRLTQQGRTVTVTHASDGVLHVMNATGLIDEFTVVDVPPTPLAES
jgi:anti-anti-sigma factor